MPTVLSGDDFGINTAALLLCDGRPVVIPTETVYGLAGNALDYDAVAEIFRIKGRPATNPLIVHVHSLDQADRFSVVTEKARLLADSFWPGPLTVILESTGVVPENVNAGGTTVGVRMPNHLVTLALLKYSNLPLAAPSANRSEGVSPTTVSHVIQSLGDLCPPILDGGDCVVGIESTVIDITQTPPRILRPGAISRQQIEQILGEKVELGGTYAVQRSPGQMSRHYAPTTRTILAELANISEPIRVNAALLYHTEPAQNVGSFTRSIGLPNDPEGYAAGLYAALHELDQSGVDLIVIESPPATEDWLAVRDRLLRATPA